MSWRLAVKRLAELGGGPLPRWVLDRDGQVTQISMGRAKEYGLIDLTKRGRDSQWILTDLGRDFAAGKVEAVYFRKGLMFLAVDRRRVSDTEIKHLLLESGHDPEGQYITPAVLRAYTARLAAAISRGAT